MSQPVSRRSFLQLASSGLAVSALGAGEAAARATRMPAIAPAPAAGPVYLNFNECPLGPAPAAQDAATRIVARSGRYLFDMARELAGQMAEIERLPADHLALYPGSSDPLNRCGALFTSAKAGVVVADPTFEAVAEVAAAQGAPVHRVPLRADGAHDVRAMAGAARDAGLIYLCNPNNPTGSITPRADIEWLLANKPASAVLLVDEAYIHYSEEASVAPLVRERQDLVVLRTFSKLYGMAGLRLGAAMAAPVLLERLERLGGNPLAVTAMAAGMASLRDPQLVPQRRAENARIRQATIAWLEEQGYACLPSQSNCFMVDVKRDGKAFAQAMQRQGVLVGRSWPVWPECVRITVGTEAEMLRFREAFLAVRR
ncbi:pyridoxal phosphate-dependent aminotransferase [[Pseudomonas] boreopolis]